MWEWYIRLIDSEFGAGDEILLLLRVYQVAVGTLPGLG